MESGFSRMGGQKESLTRRLLAAVFPDTCAGCGEEGLVLCDGCRTKVSGRLGAAFACPGCGRRVGSLGRCGRNGCRKSAADAVVSLGSYAEPSLGNLLRRWKYDGARAEGETFLGLCRDAWTSAAVWPAVAVGAAVVPVPLHPFRLALRGFNQAAVLGRALADAVGLRMESGLLRRRFSWRRQAVLNTSDRRKMTAESFLVRSGRHVPSSCLLVDDVLTTGTTLEACAAALKAAGAVRVIGLAILRGGPHPS